MVKKKDKKDDSSKGNGEDKQLKEKMAGEAMDKEKTSDEKPVEETRESEEEMMKKLQDQLDMLATKDIVTQMMMSLSSLAYKKMGLPVGTNDKFKDMDQAKLAVDSFDALFKAIMDEVSAEERENLKSSLANLQLNFVKIFP